MGHGTQHVTDSTDPDEQGEQESIRVEGREEVGNTYSQTLVHHQYKQGPHIQMNDLTRNPKDAKWNR